ncbi:MAG: efflux RND transporter periplasmic adaptor subunit [Planctomycetota bacterium]
MDRSPPRTQLRWLKALGTLVVCAAILSGAAWAIFEINRTEPTATKIKTTRKSSALVETVIVERGTFAPRLQVLGTVTPARDITLSPRVNGQITSVSENFVPGGMVRVGEELMRIDPADFQNVLSIRRSELEQAEASLEIEKGRQSLAKKELKLLESTIDETNRDLVLRAPQIASIRAEVSAAKAAVERAELELERSTILAPFDAQIISLSVNLGSQVAPGNELARLVGTAEYWVSAALPVRSLQWVQFPSDDRAGSVATLANSDAWPPGVQRSGRVTRMIGTVDDRTRLARVLITVDDPLGKASGEPPLILQSLLQVEIEGRPIRDVVRLQREFIRDDNTVWVMQDDQLQIRECKIAFQDSVYAYLKEGLETGDEVVTSTLATVAEGIGLRRINTPANLDP